MNDLPILHVTVAMYGIGFSVLALTVDSFFQIEDDSCSALTTYIQIHLRYPSFKCMRLTARASFPPFCHFVLRFVYIRLGMLHSLAVEKKQVKLKT